MAAGVDGWRGLRLSEADSALRRMRGRGKMRGCDVGPLPEILRRPGERFGSWKPGSHITWIGQELSTVYLRRPALPLH